MAVLGRLYTSSDGGENWTERQPAGDVDLKWAAVASDDDGSNLIAAVNGGRLYTSSDSGANWTERRPGGDSDLDWKVVTSDSDGSHLAAGIDNGRLYISTDSGETWLEEQPKGDANGTWSALDSDSDGSNLVAGVDNTSDLYISPALSFTWAETPLTTFARTVLDDGNAGTMRDTIGLGDSDNVTHGTLILNGGGTLGVSSGHLRLDSDGVLSIHVGTGAAAALRVYDKDSNLKYEEDVSGKPYWMIGTAGKIEYSTPGSFPGIVIWTGAGGDQNRLNIKNVGTYFQIGYDADNGTGALNAIAGGKVGIGVVSSSYMFEVATTAKIGTSLTVGTLSGVLKATAGLIAGSATLDDINDGATYGRPTLTQISNWDTAYGWGDHASGGYQAQGDILDDLNTLGAASADGQFVVATGAGALAWESGATARTSIGLGNVEDTKLSTWTGSANITTLGTISTVGNITIANNGTIGQAAGPLLTFDDTNNYLEISGCDLAVGATAPLARVHGENSASSTGTFRGVYGLAETSSDVSNHISLYGVVGTGQYDGDSSAGKNVNIIGVYGQASALSGASGTYAGVTALYGIAYNFDDDVTITNSYAIRSIIYQRGAGTLTTAYGINVSGLRTAGGTGNIGTLYGIYVNTSAIAGNVTGSHYGLYVTGEPMNYLSSTLMLAGIKSGATQAAAGAAAGELWKTNGHATLPDNVVMIGV